MRRDALGSRKLATAKRATSRRPILEAGGMVLVTTASGGGLSGDASSCSAVPRSVVSTDSSLKPWFYMFSAAFKRGKDTH